MTSKPVKKSEPVTTSEGWRERLEAFCEDDRLYGEELQNKVVRQKLAAFVAKEITAAEERVRGRVREIVEELRPDRSPELPTDYYLTGYARALDDMIKKLK